MQCSRRRRETQCATCASGLASGTRTSPVGGRNGDFPVTEDPLRVLFVTPECAPWVKTGGLGDVAAALPAALITEGVDVRVLMPAYRGVPEQAGPARIVARLPATAEFPGADLYQSALPSGVPGLPARLCGALRSPGRSLSGRRRRDYADNARRFARLAHAAALLGDGGKSACPGSPMSCTATTGRPDLRPAYLRHAIARARSDVDDGSQPGVPGRVRGQLERGRSACPQRRSRSTASNTTVATSFLKAGLFHASALSDRQPDVRRRDPARATRLRSGGAPRRRSGVLHGILNGIDTDTGIPRPTRFSRAARRRDTLAPTGGRTSARCGAQLGLPVAPTIPLLGVVSRLTTAKGLRLVAAIALRLAPCRRNSPCKAAATRARARLRGRPRAAPRSIAVTIAFDESLAHQIEAGADAFLMPSPSSRAG